MQLRYFSNKRPIGQTSQASAPAPASTDTQPESAPAVAADPIDPAPETAPLPGETARLAQPEAPLPTPASSEPPALPVSPAFAESSPSTPIWRKASAARALAANPPAQSICPPERALDNRVEASPDRPADEIAAETEADFDGPDPRAILDSIGETVYDWNIASDRIVWGPNAARVLGVNSIGDFATGRRFAESLSPESESSRYEAILRSNDADPGLGVPYQICYGLAPPGGQRLATVWVEDTGRWFAGPDGRPSHAHGLVRVITDRYKEERQLAFKSKFDTLTGALNRANLLEQTAFFFNAASRKQQSFAVLLAGVENLFLLNRTYGYDVADQVIASLAKRLRANCRETDVLARYAGNKFALVLDNCDTAEMTSAATRFLDVVAQEPFETAAGPIPVSLRIGGVVGPRNGRSAHIMFQHAEEALDLARQPGAPRFAAYEPSLAREDSRMRALKVADEIVTGLNQGRVILALQPIVNASDGKPAFYEALMRLRRSDGELTPPGLILPTAEKSGLIQLIDQRILELSIKKMIADPQLRLSINASGRTVHDPEWPLRLKSAFALAPSVASRLTIEITETCAIEDVEATARAIASIKECGAKVAMDDFGAGHTSFRNLRRLGFDLLKIDGAFVQNLPRSADDRFFVRTLIDLARHLGIAVVAEWVEDAETAKILREWGVEYLQGHYFATARVAEDPPEEKSCSVA